MKNLINLNTINNETFESILINLIGTDCKMEFINATQEHKNIAWNLGLTTIQFDESIVISAEIEDVNVWA
tara:strand:+ start:324 stop:533 length:210 start_codon:yes stop_codon:yes gene_type:complete